jgi:hypothetical protein
LLKRGYNPKKLEVVGSTKYDGIKIPDKIPKGDFVLVSTQMVSEEEQNKFLDAIIPALKKIKEKIKINLHPGQTDSLLQKYLEKYNLDVEIIPGQPPEGINYFIERCKLLINICSTTSIDALLLEKPVVTVNLSGGEDFIPYAKYGVAVGVWNKNKTEEAIKKALYDKKIINKLKKSRENFFYEYIYKNDGKASERFANLIEKLSHNKV